MFLRFLGDERSPDATLTRAWPKRSLLLACVVAASLHVSSVQGADPPPAASSAQPAAPAPAEPSPAQTQEANLRFQEGKALLEQGAIAEACEKLAQSLALHRRGGTLLNLAACRQKQGRPATAMKLFQESFDVARAEGRDDRLEIAQKGIAETRPLLSWLVITLAPGASVPGLRVALDGAPVEAAALGSMMAIDPGTHTLTVEAPGRRRHEQTVTSGAAGERRSVEIPPLAVESPGATATTSATAAAMISPAATSDAAPARSPMLGVAGVAMIGVGAAAALVGGVFGVKAIADSAESRRLCPQDVCPPDGLAKNQSARDAALPANILIPSGLAVAAAGVLVLLLPGKSQRGAGPRTAAVPWAAPSSAGLTLTGSF